MTMLRSPMGVIPSCLGALALSACVGQRPPAPTAAAIAPPAAWRTAVGPGVPVERDWWNGFRDPVLTRLVDRALANNADIAVAAARVDEARALGRLARSQQTPLVSGGASAGDGRSVVLGKGVDAFSGQPQVAISYDLDLFGRLAQNAASARANLVASSESRDAVALAVASTTASGYIALLGLDARLATTRETLAARADALHLAQRRADAGYTSRLELSQAQSEYQAALQLVPAAQLAVSRQENALSILVGDPPAAIARGGSLDTLRMPAIPDGLPSSLLRRRPDVAAAEALLVASDRSLDSARAAILPNLALTGSAGVALSTALADPITLFSLGGSILSPLFDGGRLRAQADAVAARRDQAAFSYRRTALTAFREVEDALVATTRLREQGSAIGDQVAALRETLRISTNRYREGYSPYLDQIDAQRGLLSAQLISIQIQTDRLTSLVTLYQAMGGGWQQDAQDQRLLQSAERNMQ